jgi:hypothetical protein
MLPNFLFPEEHVAGKEGEGASMALGNASGQIVQLTLGITDAIEQASLDVLVYGSADNVEWGAKPLVSFPQKFYKGVYTILLDLTASPDVKYLKVKYKANRWGHWTKGPEFGFYVFAEPLPAAV